MGLFGSKKTQKTQSAATPTVSAPVEAEPVYVTYDEISAAGQPGELMHECMANAGVTWLINGKGSPQELYESATGYIPRFADFEAVPQGIAYLPSGGDQIVSAMFHVNNGVLLVLPVFNNPSAKEFFDVKALMKMKDRWELDVCTQGGRIKAETLARLANPVAIDMNDVIPG